MLTGAQLGLAIAAVLFGAIGLGAVLHWLWLRLSPGRSGLVHRISELGDQLHEAETQRDAAELTLHEAEERHVRREAELGRALEEARADLDTLNGGLVNARQRILELEAELERQRRGV